MHRSRRAWAFLPVVFLVCICPAENRSEHRCGLRTSRRQPCGRKEPFANTTASFSSSLITARSGTQAPDSRQKRRGRQQHRPMPPVKPAVEVVSLPSAPSDESR
jgi:hypothetical protein